MNKPFSALMLLALVVVPVSAQHYDLYYVTRLSG